MSLPRAQGGQFDLDDVDAVEQVGAESLFVDGRLQVAVRGRDDSHIDADFVIAADRADLSFFQRSQQFRLHGQRQFADFVQQQRTGGCLQKEAFAVAARVGEGAFRVAEQFAFEQRFGQRGAVDGHEGTIGAAAAPMDRACHQLFARAAFAGDQHRGIGIGDARQLRVQFPHHGALTQEFTERAVPFDRFTQSLDLSLQHAVADGSLQRDRQQIHLDRLRDKVVGSRGWPRWPSRGCRRRSSRSPGSQVDKRRSVGTARCRSCRAS